MARELHSEYGPESKPGGRRAECGGVSEAKPLPYDPPKGPAEHMRAKPGLGGDNHGNKGTQGKH
jgi:hypothetical protein